MFWSYKDHPGALATHPEAMEAHPGRVEADLVTMEVTIAVNVPTDCKVSFSVVRVSL